MHVTLDPSSAADYRQFLAIKSLPTYKIRGRQAWFPDEYADIVGCSSARTETAEGYTPSPFLFDYQRDISALAIRKRKYAIFADCGLGKTLMYFEYIKAAMHSIGQRRGALLLSPLMVIEQTLEECRRWHGDELSIEYVAAADLPAWLRSCGGKVGITNYEALRGDVDRGQLGAMILDESSLLKSHYGRYGQACIELGKGLEWKLAGTGTPAPNDRIEYANHAVFFDHFPTINSFLARFFVNRGQTCERWALKPHALEPFYNALSHWCIFLTNPSVYGWRDNCESLPPIHTHIHDVPMLESQSAAVQKQTGNLFAVSAGGITKRHTLSRIAKGIGGTDTPKYEYIRNLVASWPDESTIIWCWFNEEQDRLEATFPDAASISGDTPHVKRLELIADFKAGRRNILISKPKVLGFGLNLQIATRQVFSSLIDSYEQFYQAVKRSNRYGSTRPLHVHIPVQDVERPMVENVLRKAALVQHDTEQQERIFRAASTRGAISELVRTNQIDRDTFIGE